MNKHKNLSSKFLLTELSISYMRTDAQDEKSLLVFYTSNDVEHQIADFDYYYKTVKLQDVLKLVKVDRSSVLADIFCVKASKHDNSKSSESQCYDKMYSGVSFLCVPNDIEEFTRYIESCETNKDIKTIVDDAGAISNWRESVENGEISIGFTVEIHDKEHTDMRDFEEEDVEELACRWADLHCNMTDGPVE